MKTVMNRKLIRISACCLVVALLAGLVAAFVYLWNNNKGFRDFWLKMWDKIQDACGKATKWIKNKFGDLKDALKTVRDTFSKIKDTITDKLDEARDKVKGVIDKIKGFFPLKIGKIFSNLKIPKISIKGGKAPYGIGGFGTKPSISVSWNKKAMDNPYLFSDATLFGAGEAGDEVLYGRNSLMNDIACDAKDIIEKVKRASGVTKVSPDASV